MSRTAAGAPTKGLRADPAATAQRLQALRAYMDANVLGPDGFSCEFEDACRGSVHGENLFYEGQLSHVGRHYDLHLDGRALRVMVVGQEDGSDRTLVTLDQRYEKIYNEAAMARRYSSDGAHVRRSFHMRGTTSALRLIFGKELGTDWEGEFIHDTAGSAFHIFDAFALVNALLEEHRRDSTRCLGWPARGRTTGTGRCLDRPRSHLDDERFPGCVTIGRTLMPTKKRATGSPQSDQGTADGVQRASTRFSRT